jgi:type IV secretion system protein TrbJ
MKKLALVVAICATSALTIGTSLALAPSPAAAMPVFDATNYTQNILQAARALEQVNNQIQSLQNEAAMLQNMARNLDRIEFPEVQKLSSAMSRIDGLIGEAKGIGFKVDALDEKIRGMFPKDTGIAVPKDSRLAAAKARLDAARDSFEHAMKAQAQVAENVREDAGLLAGLIERSQGAVGGLQAQQAANQLLALSVKQQLQLQDLFAAQFRDDALERARKTKAEEDGKAATRRFLGTRKAYTPAD